MKCFALFYVILMCGLVFCSDHVSAVEDAAKHTAKDVEKKQPEKAHVETTKKQESVEKNVHNKQPVKTNLPVQQQPAKVQEENGHKDTEKNPEHDMPDPLTHHSEQEEENLHLKDSFDPYEEGSHHDEHDGKEPDVPLDQFDFDPSQGLTFQVNANSKSCFYQDIKTDQDKLSGAYVSSTANPQIDIQITGPNGEVVFHKVDVQEGEYDEKPKQLGLYEICFLNKHNTHGIVTHVTETLESQHPAGKEHVSHLAKSAKHIDIRLGELESEQRLLQLRTDRHVKTEESTNQRVTYYATIECFVYVVVAFAQVFYIKSLLDNPTQRNTWA